MRKKTILFLFIIFGFLGLAFNNASADTAKILGGLDQTADTAELSKTGTIPEIIGKVLGAILSFTGIVFFILMIYGGILWMTSAGNEEQSKKAKNVITAAVIGIIIVASAYAITSFVSTTLEGETSTAPPSTPQNI